MAKNSHISAPMPMDDTDYRAMADVDAMTRAHEVKSDPKRHAKAKAHAKKMLAEHKKKGKALSRVAGKEALGQYLSQ